MKLRKILETLREKRESKLDQKRIRNRNKKSWAEMPEEEKRRLKNIQDWFR